MSLFFLLIFPFFIHFINLILKKKNIIPNYSGNTHQKLFDSTSIPLSGGFFIFLILIFISFGKLPILILSIILIFLLGIFSDINFLSSPKWRFFLQAILLFTFVYFSEINIYSIRISLIDLYLENFLISCLFTTFCIMIAVNGTNFIDGLNGLVLSYYLLISFFIYILGLVEILDFDISYFIILVQTIVYLTIFNFLNKLYLGDSGSYLIGFIFSYFLISIYKNSINVSPYFIALLLWYPAFEILFSIMRKLKFSKSPIDADNNHFHHLLYFFINKKFNLKKNFSNNVSSCLIIFYNLVVFSLSIYNINHSLYQIFLITLNIAIYLLLYMKLYKFNYLKSI